MKHLLLSLFLTFGLVQPAAAVTMGDDGLHKAAWMRDTFKDMAEDLAEAQAEGRVLMILIEQRGCIYCRRMHETVFNQPQIESLLDAHFFVVQLDLRGATEMYDFDGTALSEKDMAARWGQRFTPIMMFFDQAPQDGLPTQEAAFALIPGALELEETHSLLLWASDADARNAMTLNDFHAARTGN